MERTAKNSTLCKFDTWHEWIDAARDIPHVPESMANMPADEWNGNVTYSQAVSIALKGWPEGTNRVKIQAERIGTILSTMVEQTQYTYDVEGQTLDVAAYLNGEPECWLNPVPVRVEGIGSRLVKVVVNGGGLSDRSALEYQTRGAAVCAMIQVLELNGYACEVWYTKSSLNKHASETSKLAYITHLVKIKSYDNALDLDRLAFALSHPAQYRRLIFGHTEKITRKRARTMSIETEPEHQGDIYIGLNEGVLSDDYAAADWARTRIAKIQETKTELSN